MDQNIGRLIVNPLKVKLKIMKTNRNIPSIGFVMNFPIEDKGLKSFLTSLIVSRLFFGSDSGNIKNPTIVANNENKPAT